MVKVIIEEIQRYILHYLHQVEAGETFVVVKFDEAIAEIRPIPSRQQL